MKICVYSSFVTASGTVYYDYAPERLNPYANSAWYQFEFLGLEYPYSLLTVSLILIGVIISVKLIFGGSSAANKISKQNLKKKKNMWK